MLSAVRRLSLEPFYFQTSPMRREAASTGFYESPWGKHPRIQLLTMENLLGGKSIDYPQDADVTFKKAQRVRSTPSEQKKIEVQATLARLERQDGTKTRLWASIEEGRIQLFHQNAFLCGRGV